MRRHLTKRQVVMSKTGWWKVEIVNFESLSDLSDTTLEHIAECIKEGFREGQIVEEDIYNNEK